MVSLRLKYTNELAVPLRNSSMVVTVSIKTNPGGGTLSGNMVSNLDSSGFANFSGLGIDKYGANYVLTFSTTRGQKVILDLSI